MKHTQPVILIMLLFFNQLYGCNQKELINTALCSSFFGITIPVAYISYIKHTENPIKKMMSILSQRKQTDSQENNTQLYREAQDYFNGLSKTKQKKIVNKLSNKNIDHELQDYTSNKNYALFKRQITGLILNHCAWYEYHNRSSYKKTNQHSTTSAGSKNTNAAEAGKQQLGL